MILIKMCDSLDWIHPGTRRVGLCVPVGVTENLNYFHKWVEIYAVDKLRNYQLLKKDCAACGRLTLVGTVTTSTKRIPGLVSAVRL